MSAAKRKETAGNAPTRPIMPRLAASAQPSRASPAPKLAGYNATPPLKRPATTQTTPTVPSARSSTEDKATPVSNFVNANVTPRSSSRKSRAGSSQSTPVTDAEDTPTRSRPTSTIGFDGVGRKQASLQSDRPDSTVHRLKTQQLGLQSNHQSLPTTPNISQSPEQLIDLSNGSERPSFFFYANEGPAAEKAPTRPQYKKTGSFVYANGTSESNTFPAANNAQKTAQPPSSVQAQYGTTVKPLPLSVPANSQQQQRQPSPPRQGFHLTYRKGASQVIPPHPLSPPITEHDSSKRRKSSIDEDDSRRHSRAFSASSLASGDHAFRKEGGFPFLSMFSLPSSKNSSMASPTADASLRSSGDRDGLQALDTTFNGAQSPPSAIGSSNSDQNRAEAAAYARRERKIMDLEISNSSLLVINKSLEREIKKQKTELRRYKRLSRKSSMEVVRVSAGRMSLLTEDEEEDDEERSESPEEESGDDESESDSLADEPMSPGAVAQRDARHRKHDQLRLKKDLAKHKELLADSQKMNQSLKKCMSITESLIQEGNKALAYKVDHEDLKLGGRVLSQDDLTGSDVAASGGFDIGDEQSEMNISGVPQGSATSPRSLERLARSRTTSELLGETF